MEFIKSTTQIVIMHEINKYDHQTINKRIGIICKSSRNAKMIYLDLRKYFDENYTGQSGYEWSAAEYSDDINPNKLSFTMFVGQKKLINIVIFIFHTKEQIAGYYCDAYHIIDDEKIDITSYNDLLEFVEDNDKKCRDITEKNAHLMYPDDKTKYWRPE